MQPIKFLSKENVDLIKENAKDVLEEVGVKLPHERALSLLRADGCEVDEENQVVRIPRSIVEDYITEVPKSFKLYSRDRNKSVKIGGDEVHFGTVGFATKMVSEGEDSFRPLTTDDLVQLTKLADGLPNVDVIMTMGQPTNVPNEISESYMWKIPFENSSKPILSQAAKMTSIQDAIEMATTVAGDEESVKEKPDLCLVFCTASPLTFEKEYTKALVHATEFGLPIFFDSGPMTGATSPVSLAGTVTLATTELFAGIAITRAINRDTPMMYAAWSRSLDLRTGAAVFGGPEYALINAANVQIARSIGIPVSTGGILTDSNVSDAQAGYEKGFSSSILGLANANLICGMGLLASENACSLEQLVIDNEIASMVQKFRKGIDVNEEKIASELIKEVGILGSFAKKKHTLEFYREELWRPEISNRLSADAWQEKGAKSIRETAREKAQQILETHQPSSLSDQVCKKLEEIISRREEELRNG